MQNENDVKNLEKLIVQLQGLHSEISVLAKKSPNDGLNLFKLKLVNKVIAQGNEIFTEHYKPFEDLEGCEEETLPTNSDVTMILALYIEKAERYRPDNIVDADEKWQNLVNGE